MPTLTITKSYNDGEILNESDIDDIKTSLETFFNTTKIDSDNIQDGGVDADALASNAVTTIKLNAAAVTTGKIADSAATTAKLGPGSVTTAKIADSAVIATKLNLDSLSTTNTDHIWDHTSRPKDTAGTVVSPDVAISGSSGSFTTSTTSYADVTNMSITITSIGRPVKIEIHGASDDFSGLGAFTDASDAYDSLYMNWRILRDSTVVSAGIFGSKRPNTSLNGRAAFIIPPSAISALDFPSAGTYVYKLQVKIDTGSTIFGGTFATDAGTDELAPSCGVQDCTLVAYEI